MNFLRRSAKANISHTVDFVIFSADLKKRMYDRTKRIVDYEGIDYCVQMTMSHELAAILEKEGAANIHQMMIDDANRVVNQYVQRLDVRLKDFRKKVQRSGRSLDSQDDLRNLMQAEAALRHDCATIIRAVVKDLDGIPEKYWNQFTTAKSEYKKYKIKAGVKLVAGATGTTVSICALAAGGATGGASLALGIVGLQRSIVGLMQNVKSLSQTAEAVLNELVKDIVALNSSYGKSHGKARLAGRELASGFSRALTGGLSGVRSGSRMREHHSLLKDKRNGLLVNGTKLTRQLCKQLDELHRLDAQIRNREMSPKSERRLKALSQKASDQITLLLDWSIDYNRRWINIGNILSYLEPHIASLNAKNPKGAAVAARALEMCVNLGLASASGAIGIQDAKDVFNQVKEISSIVKDFATEATTAGLDIKEVMSEEKAVQAMV